MKKRLAVLVSILLILSALGALSCAKKEAPSSDASRTVQEASFFSEESQDSREDAKEPSESADSSGNGEFSVPPVIPISSDSSGTPEISVPGEISETAETSEPVEPENSTEISVPGETSESSETSEPAEPAEGSGFEIFFLDVGQGDAACVLCDGHAMLIDGGNNSQSSLIYSFLRSHQIDYLDYIVASHPDADHIGGLSGALNYAQVGKAYCTVTENETETFLDFVRYLSIQGLSVTVPSPGETFFLGSARVVILYPEAGEERSDNTSIALRIEYGETSFFFTGDCETEDEQALLALGMSLRSDVLKVAHHGSRSSTTPEFLLAVSPRFAVISVGGRNPYGHPTQEVLERLKEKGTVLYRTDIQGDIHCCSDGKTVTFDTEKKTDFDTFEAAGGYGNYLDGQNNEESPPSGDTSGQEESGEDSVSDRTVPSDESGEESGNSGITYIANISTHKFHRPDCASVMKMKEKNKWYFTGTREELIELGYSPCKNCDP